MPLQCPSRWHITPRFTLLHMEPPLRLRSEMDTSCYFFCSLAYGDIMCSATSATTPEDNALKALPASEDNVSLSMAVCQGPAL